MLQIRGVLEERLVRHPWYESIGQGTDGMLEGFGCNLIGEFEVQMTVGDFGGEYNLRLSAGYPGRLINEDPLAALIGRNIAITGYATGFGSIDYVLVALSSIKRLDRDGLLGLQDRLTEVEFLLKTIGLISAEEVDSEEDPEGISGKVIKIRRPKRVREI
jgi:hypothetical protein